ncbi:hypothetical protein C2845_PM13G02010 [Panicum miliaceum]|uniref:Uncharacterized protein n=1 Tax=Panicum miliaceum TaxID=4540 RepID=A0A3L6RGR2_PANMI|nr:hypothetical protein C2845_PM13G02010 [Panicum miliaceum]
MASPPHAVTVRGAHQFEIVGYRWSVRFYPGGFSPPHRALVSAFLKLTSKDARA